VRYKANAEAVFREGVGNGRKNAKRESYLLPSDFFLNGGKYLLNSKLICFL